MKCIGDYLDIIIKDEQKLANMKAELECMADRLSPNERKKFHCQMHCLAFGPHFDREMAEWYVGKMHNVDGSIGETWSYEEAENLAKKYNVDNIEDFYVAINVMISDARNIIGNNEKMYCELAKALYFADPDMKDGKLFRQLMA